MLQITILLCAFFTFLCGFAQDFNQPFVFRALQGLGLGADGDRRAGRFLCAGIWLPTYLHTVRGLSTPGTGSYLVVHIIGAWFGFIAGALLADKIGRKATFLVSALASAIAVVPFMMLPITNEAERLVSVPLASPVHDVLAHGS